MESKFWGTSFAFWLGILILIAALAVWSMRLWFLDTFTHRRRDRWLTWLIEHGPVGLDSVPTFDGKVIPWRKYLRAGWIEADDQPTPMLHASGLAKMIIRPPRGK